MSEVKCIVLCCTFLSTMFGIEQGPNIVENERCSYFKNPAYCIMIFDTVIKSGNIQDIKRLVSFKKTFQFYDAAVILQDACKGIIRKDTPFSSQESWIFKIRTSFIFHNI